MICRPVDRSLDNERGIALIIVVTVVAMLTIVVFEFAYSVTIDQYRVRNSLHALQSELMVRSGVHLAEGFLGLDEDDSIDTPSDEWFWMMKGFCSSVPPLPNGSLVKCDIKDESGKLNVNLSRPPRGREIVPGEASKETILLDAMTCIFQRREGIDAQTADNIRDYWNSQPPELPDGSPQRQMPIFQSIEEFAARFGIATRHIGYLKKYLTAHPPGRLRGVNINFATAEVLSAILNNQDIAAGCGIIPEVQDILERRQDPDNPIKRADIRSLMGSLDNAQLLTSLFVSNSSLYRLEASAISNPDPERPTQGGVGKTLSVVVYRRCAEQPGQKCVRWTTIPLDWQKEGGARLFREKNRFSGLSEYYGDFDPSDLGNLFDRGQ